MPTITGYQRDQQGVWIAKDTDAKLVYSMDWSQWLPLGAKIQTVAYTENSRLNDADPVIIHSQGVTSDQTQTYVELSGGFVGRVYTVTADVTLDNGARDRRNFRLKIENRSA